MHDWNSVSCQDAALYLANVEYRPGSYFRQLSRRSQDISTAKQQKGVSFEEMPGEIRNQIYQELLVNRFPLQLVNSSLIWPDLNDPGDQLCPAILATNKKISFEASAILYGHNTFYVHLDTEPDAFAPMQRCEHNTGPGIAKDNAVRIRKVLSYCPEGMIIQREELVSKYAELGIDFAKLRIFAVGFGDVETMNMNAKANSEWLSKMPASELKSLVEWFPGTELSWAADDTIWLVYQKLSV